MSWARIDDGFHDHPKVDDLSLSAVGLWTLCLTHAHRHRRTAALPGHITEARVRKVAGRQAASLSAELVTAGLWEPASDIGGWVVHDFNDYLPKQRDSKEASEAGKRGAAKRWHDDGYLMADSYEDDAYAMAADSTRASAPAYPTRPVPNPTQKTKTTASLGKPSQTDLDRWFGEFWTVFPKKVAKASAQRRFETLVKRGTDPQEIINGAKAYRESRHGEDPQYTKQPDGWLNAGRWQDEPPPTSGELMLARPSAKPATTDSRAAAALELSQRLKASGE